MKNDTDERKLEIKQYRVGLFLGATAYPFFGWFSEKYVPNDFDSLLIRLPIALLSALLLCLTYTKLGMKFIRVFILLVAVVAFNLYAQMFCQSNYHFYYSIGITALPFIIFTFLFHPIDVILFFGLSLASLFYYLKELNFVFLSVYLILVMMAFLIYIFVIKSRLDLLKKLRLNLEEINSKNKSLLRIGELAAQVAHDIRSPVGALKAISSTMSDEDKAKKQLIQKTANRIDEIASYLVSEYKLNLSDDLSKDSTIRASTLNEVVEDIISEKLLEYPLTKIEFKETIKINAPDYLNLVEFKRMLSNLLNNSIQAILLGPMQITVDLSKTNNGIKLQISDNGKGIPTEYLDKVFEAGIKFEKKEGSGLGLYHAKQFIESIHGSIDLQSQVDKGTAISIFIPEKKSKDEMIVG